jgi:two-component system chemotaxis response regulator CheB
MARGKVRVLVVDDSAFARVSISRQLSADSEIEVIDVARNGIEALGKVRALKPDVVTLDVEMPRMDGLTALHHIMSECPTPVVMLSSLTAEGATETITALERGAVDFLVKSRSSVRPLDSEYMVEDLRTKVKQAATVDVSRLCREEKEGSAGAKAKQRRRRATKTRKVVVIGSSTGGPGALRDVISSLPVDLPAPILIVQHMPPKFTKALAERLDSISLVSVKEAELGDRLVPGQALVAPGDYHMTVDEKGNIELNHLKPEHGVRPAVNVTLEAVAQHYGPLSLCVILTGMGSDGTRGAALIKAAGGKVFVEHESTCVVYGMPKSIVDAGSADKILPRPEIAQAIIDACNEETDVAI